MQNWQWDGLAGDIYERPKQREPAWLRLDAGDSSSITYVIPFTAGPNGYDSKMEVHLDTVSLTSSLNDIQLVNAESCRVSPNPPPILDAINADVR